MSRTAFVASLCAATLLAACEPGSADPSPSNSGSFTESIDVSAEPTESGPPTLDNVLELDAEALLLGDPAPVALIKTGPSWLYLVDASTHSAERVDVSALGAQGYNATMDGDVAWDGVTVVFDSGATDIVPGDTNGVGDVFLSQVDAGSVIRVSETAAGEANGGSFEPRISADGSTIVFTGFATNLLPGVATVPQVYRYDVPTGQLSLLVPSAGAGSPYTSSPAVTAGGRFVAYASSTQGEYGDDNYYGDVFLVDTKTGATEQISVATDGMPGNFFSGNPSISLTGQLVAFESEADNLAPDDSNTVFDVFVRDRASKTTRLVSRNPAGLPGNGDSMTPLIANGGEGVVFGSQASDLVAGDTNDAYDVFYADLATGAVTRLSVGAGGVQANGDSYPDAVYGGRYLVFSTYATNLGGDGDDGPMRQYIRDLETGSLWRFL